ncbi:MAG TPA: Tex-like N-terminal domain-containing protein, partial [Saprospiraceae bacterium]|nr:Tex-like N-terminal domain-containing protein [Saprospiraceae bacterium]
MNTAIIQQIQSNTGIHQKSVDHTVAMLEEGLTVPFISRYRKERSGGLKDDEVQNIADQLQQLSELEARKETILKAIRKQEQLTPDLEKQIKSCWDAAELEDLYLPFKKSKKSRAHKAREAGLEPLAELILDRELHNIPEEAKRFINDQVPDADEAIEGAKDII